MSTNHKLAIALPRCECGKGYAFVFQDGKPFCTAGVSRYQALYGSLPKNLPSEVLREIGETQ